MKSCKVSAASLSSDLVCTVVVEIYIICVSQIAAEREKELQKEEEERQQTSIALKKAKEEQAPKTFKAGVGKYINPAKM